MDLYCMCRRLLPFALLLSVSCGALAVDDGRFDSRQLFAPLPLPGPVNSYRSGSGRPGPAYWQNRADYRLDAAIEPADHSLHGEEVISYSNNSPDPLDVLWLQLEQNTYRQDARSADFRAPSAKKETAQTGARPTTQGYRIEAVSLLQGDDKTPLQYLIDDTRMRIDLPQPLAARGGKIQLQLRYSYRIPGEWGGRTAVTSSDKGDIYEIAQWYPRMAVYDDLRGWDTQPYLGAEFYLEYGDFDYNLTLPGNWLVAGSGELVNPKEVLSEAQQGRLAKAKNSDSTVYIVPPEEVGKAAGSQPRTWRFHMEHTRDVAFSASPAFVWDAARINLPGNKTALAMSLYASEGVGADKWNRSTEYLKSAVEHFSQWHPYPWPVAVNVGGYGAGMEYPGLVLDGYRDAGKKLFWITAHEIGHTWFPMLVGSNERRHAFMDEGFNTFIDVYASDAFNKGEYAPKRDSEYAPGGDNPVEEILPLLADRQAPTLMDLADATSEKYRHSLTYFKGALGLVLLREQILGPERFDPAFRAYIDAWAYKHPSPSDFFRFMESRAGEDLSWWWRGWYFNNWQSDMGIQAAAYVDGDPAKGLRVTLKSRHKLVLPVTLRAQLADGSHLDRRVPVEAWIQQASPEIVLSTTQKVISVALDPDQRLPDTDRKNNRLKL